MASPIGELEDDYSELEVRNALKLYHYLPRTYPIVLDLSRVYPLLGVEWQDVFNLYTRGFSHQFIARYWAEIHGKSVAGAARDQGNRVLQHLVKRLHWLLGLGYREIPMA